MKFWFHTKVSQSMLFINNDTSANKKTPQWGSVRIFLYRVAHKSLSELVPILIGIKEKSFDMIMSTQYFWKNVSPKNISIRKYTKKYVPAS